MHTPTPWKIDSSDSQFHPAIRSENEDHIATVACEDAEGRANAEFLVRACNVHEELLEALQNWFECADEHDIPCRCGRDRARAAIAKATKPIETEERKP